MELGLSRRSKWLLLAAALALLLFIALAWQRIARAIAFASADTRPALLRDAQWGKPETAVAFQQRFGRGSSEADLVRWLESNRFQVDQSTRHASLRVEGAPCAENIAVSWNATGGNVDASRAVVSEAGCL